MDDLDFVRSADAVKTAAFGCARCQPPVLCTRHVADLTAVRRQREATLLVGPTSSTSHRSAA